MFGKLFGKKSGTAASAKAESEGAKVKDVVCGMSIDPKTAAAKSEYSGKTYYFCAVGCKKIFDANPAKYAGGGAQETGAGHHHM
jgi:Cu+-exporting ATPase